jgi:hypothetical protein
MQITVKVRPRADAKPAALVRKTLASCHPDVGDTSKVEEVFPGLTTGRRAGMVTVDLPKSLSDEASRAVLRALRDHDDIEYAEAATPRTRKKR